MTNGKTLTSPERRTLFSIKLFKNMQSPKFRIWNGSEMVYDVISGKFGIFYVNPANEGLDENDSVSLTRFNTKYPDETPVMMYTGINDKSNKEIYSGDIVKVLNSGITHWNTEKFRVYYCEDTAQFMITNDKSFPHDIVADMAYKQFEIIGHQYK